MTDGEITFHLREICPHWTHPRITSATAAALEQEKLIEFSPDRLLVRLTPTGVQRKIAGRTVAPESKINLERARQRKPRTPRRFSNQKRRSA